MVWPLLAAAIPAATTALGAGGAATAAGGTSLLGGGSLMSGLGTLGGGGSLFSMGAPSGLEMGADMGLGMGGDVTLPGDDMLARIEGMGGGGGGGQQEPPRPPGTPGPDVSGFAAAGMTPPGLWDMGQFNPQTQLANTMGLATAGDPHQQSKIDSFQQRRQGGLMSYLDSLGV